MKRTPKNGGEKRDAVFRFRVNAAEKKLIEQNAAAEGLTVSDFIRKRADEEAQDNASRNILIRLLADIGKQGSNLNQYTKAMNIWINTGKEPPFDPGTIRECLIEITRLSQELLEFIKHGHRRKDKR